MFLGNNDDRLYIHLINRCFIKVHISIVEIRTML